MSQRLSPEPIILREQSEPSDRRWSREEYYRLAEQGFFNGQRVELLGGRIIHMSAQGLPHTQCVELVDLHVRQAFLTGHRFRVRMPFRAADGSDPEPDVLVMPGNPRDPMTGHPTSGVLIVEVAETSLRRDRNKAKICAASGIQDYWIVNLLDETLEIYREPMSNPSDTLPAYASVRLLKAQDVIAPVANPSTPVKVADLLP